MTLAEHEQIRHVLALAAAFWGIIGLAIFATGLLAVYSPWWWLTLAPWLILEAAAAWHAHKVRQLRREARASD